jgi:hypothetical protein
MSTIAAALRPIPLPKPETLRRDPAAQAFTLLRVAFTVAPILFGLDKFAEVMISDWPKYLAPEFNNLIPGSAQDAMYMVGAVEIVAGLVVALSPRFGGLLVAGWLAGIIVSLLLVGGYADIALRDFGLLVGALALSRLATGRKRSPRASSATSASSRAASAARGSRRLGTSPCERSRTSLRRGWLALALGTGPDRCPGRGVDHVGRVQRALHRRGRVRTGLRTGRAGARVVAKEHDHAGVHAVLPEVDVRLQRLGLEARVGEPIPDRAAIRADARSERAVTARGERRHLLIAGQPPVEVATALGQGNGADRADRSDCSHPGGQLCTSIHRVNLPLLGESPEMYNRALATVRASA